MASKDVNTKKIAPKIWRDGEFIDWDDARIHVMAHVVNYGIERFRRHPLLQNDERLGDFSSDRTYAEAL